MPDTKAEKKEFEYCYEGKPLRSGYYYVFLGEKWGKWLSYWNNDTQLWSLAFTEILEADQYKNRVGPRQELPWLGPLVPKKLEAMVSNIQTQAEESKPKRGRPRKIVSSESQNPPVKRGRGRPRKVQIVA